MGTVLVFFVVLGALVAAPASARAAAVSEPGSVGASLVSDGKAVLATWHAPGGDRLRLVARLLGPDGTPRGKIRRTGPGVLDEAISALDAGGDAPRPPGYAARRGRAGRSHRDGALARCHTTSRRPRFAPAGGATSA